MARTEASASSLRREPPRSYGLVAASALEAGRRQCKGDGGAELAAGPPEVARTELDLGADGAREDLAIGVLEDQADMRRELRDGHRAAASSSPTRTRPSVGRSSPLR